MSVRFPWTDIFILSLMHKYILMNKLFVVCLLLLSGSIFAQRSNVANINTIALWDLMPEKKSADSTILELNKTYSEHFTKMNTEIEALIYSYKNDEKATPAIKADIIKDIEARQARMENFKKEAEADLAKRREELLAPIRKKMQDAINAVAKKYKYDYVIDSSFGNIIYTKNPADDILDLVKKELGL